MSSNPYGLSRDRARSEVAAWSRLPVAPLAAMAFLVAGAALPLRDVHHQRSPAVDLPLSTTAGMETCCAPAPTIPVTVCAPRSAAEAPQFHVRGSRVTAPRLGELFRTLVSESRSADASRDAAVVIRADRSAPWFHVQTVLAACAEPGVDLYRIHFVTRPPHPEGEGLR